MKTRENKSRRDFLKTGSLAAAGFFIVPRHVMGRGFIAPSDKLTDCRHWCRWKRRE